MILYEGGTDLPDWSPVPKDVASFIARLVPDQEGLALGDFTTQTVPSFRQVAERIEKVVADVQLTVGTIPDDPALKTVAGDVAALGAAVRVAEAFFPEIEQDYIDRMTERWTTALERLRGNVDRISGGTADGTRSGPAGSFPPALDYSAAVLGGF